MISEHVIELKNLFGLAEKYAKEVEMLRSELQIPAINELRYAGHHILAAINDEGSVDEVKLVRAKSHCQRAMYEAVESGIMFCLDEIKDFQEQYKDVVVSEVIADYPDRLARAQKAVAIIVQGRRDRASMEAQVEEYVKEFRVVREILGVFIASRNDLNAKRVQAKALVRRHQTRITVIILVAVLGSVAAVFFS